MEPRYITLKKNEENFFSYLDGSFSSEWRALPEQSLNVNTAREQVTFRLIPMNQIHHPGWIVLLFKLFRLEWSSLSLGPVLATYSYLAFSGQQLNHFNAILAIIAVLVFHAAVFAMNDYRDHIKGVDRLSLKGGSQVIQQGWLSAQTVRRVGLTLFGLGSCVGLYLILKQPFFLMAVGLFTGVSVLGYSFYGQGLKYLGFGEVVAFFCFGPLLTYGFSRAASYSHSWEILFLGLGFGFLSALCLQSRQLENIISDSQVGVKSLAVRLGFDRMKQLLELELLIGPILFLATLYVVGAHLAAYFLLIPLAYFTLRVYVGLRQSRSSLSSRLDGLRLRVSDLHILYSTLLLISFWLADK